MGFLSACHSNRGYLKQSKAGCLVFLFFVVSHKENLWEINSRLQSARCKLEIGSAIKLVVLKTRVVISTIQTALEMGDEAVRLAAPECLELLATYGQLHRFVPKDEVLAARKELADFIELNGDSIVNLAVSQISLQMWLSSAAKLIEWVLREDESIESAIEHGRASEHARLLFLIADDFSLACWTIKQLGKKVPEAVQWAANECDEFLQRNIGYFADVVVIVETFVADFDTNLDQRDRELFETTRKHRRLILHVEEKESSDPFDFPFRLA